MADKDEIEFELEVIVGEGSNEVREDDECALQADPLHHL